LKEPLDARPVAPTDEVIPALSSLGKADDRGTTHAVGRPLPGMEGRLTRGRTDRKRLFEKIVATL